MGRIFTEGVGSTKVLLQLGLDGRTIISSVSCPEIGCLQNNQNGYQRSNHSGVPEHGMWLPKTTSQVWHKPHYNLQMGTGLSRGT
jgi:hypothetical protein